MSSPRLLRVAALIEVLALLPPILFVFLGAAVYTCLGGINNCGQPVLMVPPIRTNEGMILSLAVCALAWLAANYVILGHLARVDRPRLLRLAVGIGIVGLAMANVGFAHGLRFRLFYAAEGAVTWGIAGLGLAWVIGLAWVGLRASQPHVKPSVRAVV
jgi:hypothetical protein